MQVSKELFEAVMGDEYRDRLVDVLKSEEDAIRTYYDCGKGEPTCLGLEVPYNDLFFKCEDWAFEQGYMPMYNPCDKVYSIVNQCDRTFHKIEDVERKQGLFDACQWILENK